VNSAPWRVELTRTATRDLRRLDPPVRQRVQTALQALAANPQQPGALRKLTRASEHRLRVGDWRALLLLDAQARTITVTRVLPRGRAYHDWPPRHGRSASLPQRDRWLRRELASAWFPARYSPAVPALETAHPQGQRPRQPRRSKPRLGGRRAQRPAHKSPRFPQANPGPRRAHVALTASIRRSLTEAAISLLTLQRVEHSLGTSHAIIW